MLLSILSVVLGLILLMGASDRFVESAVRLARTLGVSIVLIGALIVGLGTSLPELAVSITSAVKNEHGMAIGNIIGSNIFNLLAVIGIAGTIMPSTNEPSMLVVHFPVMIGLTVALYVMTYSLRGIGMINRYEGAALLLTFIAYHTYVYRAAL